MESRKSNRLKGYDYSTNGAYFITICTQNRVEMFWKIENISDINVGVGVLDDPRYVSNFGNRDVKLSEYGKIVNKIILQINNFYKHINISNYVIMPNHIHILVEIIENKNNDLFNKECGKSSRICDRCGTSRTPSPTNAVLPSLVSTLKRFINKEIGFPVFQRSYHDHIIRNEQEYSELWKYIDNNPYSWENDCFYTKN